MKPHPSTPETIETEHTRIGREAWAEAEAAIRRKLEALDLTTEQGRLAAAVCRGQLVMLRAWSEWMMAERERGHSETLILNAGMNLISNLLTGLIATSAPDGLTRATASYALGRLHRIVDDRLSLGAGSKDSFVRRYTQSAGRA